MDKLKRMFLGCILAMSGATANAALHCEGLVDYALLYSEGTVNIRGAWRGDFTIICNTNGTVGGISAEICLSWYASAAKAAADGKRLAVYYATDSYTCANLPTYSSALVPVYVGVAR